MQSNSDPEDIHEDIGSRVTYILTIAIYAFTIRLQ